MRLENILGLLFVGMSSVGRREGASFMHGNGLQKQPGIFDLFGG